jgi:hypothetical protein
MAAATVINDDSLPFELHVLNASEQLRQERAARAGNGLRTGIKSVDFQFKDLFDSGRVIGLGQKTDDEAFVRLFPTSSETS